MFELVEGDVNRGMHKEADADGDVLSNALTSAVVDGDEERVSRLLHGT